MKNVKVNYANFLADFNLFLCESFGDRDSAYFNHIANGEIFVVKSDSCDMYIRLWEYSGNYGLPDYTVIIVRATYTTNPRENFENLLCFLKAYAPLYGYTNITTEGAQLSYDYDETDYGLPVQKDYSREPWLSIPVSELQLP